MGKPGQVYAILGDASGKIGVYKMELQVVSGSGKQDLTGVGMSDDLALAAFLSLCSGALEKPVQELTAILGTITIGGSISSIDNLSDLLQVCLDAGAKKVLIPLPGASKISTVPPDLFSKF